MRAFKLARTDRQIVADRRLIVQLIQAIAQIAVTAAYHGVGIINLRRFQVHFQRIDDLTGMRVLQSFDLPILPGRRPSSVGRDRRRGSAEVLADMVKINQIGAAR